MKFAIDVTPRLINRTGIFRLIKCAEESLTKFDRRFCGLPVSEGVASWKYSSGLIRRALSFLFSHELLLRILLPLFRGTLRILTAQRRTLYFDPLYSLFEPRLNNAIVIVLDLTPITCPEFHPKAIQSLYKLAFRRIQNSNCKIVAISKSTARDLWVNLGVAPDEVAVIPLFSPFAEDHFRAIASSDRHSSYLLIVSSFERRKNLKNLILAYAKSGLADENIELKIVGGSGYGHHELRFLANQTAGVELIGSAPDDVLHQLYAGCLGLVFVSLWEGFGLPYLEAMALSKPILASTTGASPEVCGTEVLYADPTNVEEIALQMRNLAKLSPQRIQSMLNSYDSIVGRYSKESYLKGLQEISNEIQI